MLLVMLASVWAAAARALQVFRGADRSNPPVSAELIYNHVCAGSLVLWCRYLVLEDKQPKKNFIKQNMKSKMKWSSLSVYHFLLADVGLGAKSKSSGQIIRNRSNISNCNSWGFAILYIVSSRYLLSPRTRSINVSCSWTAELSWCRGDAASQSESSKVQ